MEGNACSLHGNVKGTDTPSLLGEQLSKSFEELNLNELDKEDLRLFSGSVYYTLSGQTEEGKKLDFFTKVEKYYSGKKDRDKYFDKNGEPTLEAIINMKSPIFKDVLNSMFLICTENKVTLKQALVNKLNKDISQLNNNDDLLESYIQKLKYIKNFNTTTIFKNVYNIKSINAKSNKLVIIDSSENSKNFINKELQYYDAFMQTLQKLGFSNYIPLFKDLIIDKIKNYNNSINDTLISDSFKSFIEVLKTFENLNSFNSNSIYSVNILYRAVLIAVKDNPHFNNLKEALTLEDVNNLINSDYMYTTLSDYLLNKTAAQYIVKCLLDPSYFKLLPTKLSNSIKLLTQPVLNFYNVNTSYLTDVYNTILENNKYDVEEQEAINSELEKQRSDLFSNLVHTFDRILRNTSKLEHYKLNNKVQQNRIRELLSYSNSINTEEGFNKFLKQVYSELMILNDKVNKIDSKEHIQEKLQIAREIQNAIKNYSFILESLSSYLNKHPQDKLKMNPIFTQSMKDISLLINNFNITYKRIAAPSFSEYFLKHFGLSEIPVYSKKGMKMFPISTFLELTQNDISLGDRWLNSMADSSNSFLRLIDVPVQDAKNKINKDVNELSVKIQALGKNFSNFNFLYEKDSNGKKTGFYVDGENLTGKEKEFYNAFMEIKTKLDKMIPYGKKDHRTTIKITKDLTEGITSSKSLKEVGSTIADAIKHKFFVYTNDVGDYALENISYDVDGKPLESLPVRFTNLYGNDTEENVSTDAVSTLIAYADMAITYDKMSEIINVLEMGRTILLQSRITKNNNNLINNEDGISNVDITSPALMSNLIKKINDYFSGQIYGHYTKNQGNLNIFGYKASVAKTANAVNQLSAVSTIGINVSTALSNVTTGSVLLYGEALSGEFFNIKDLFWADKTFNKALPAYIINATKRIPTDKFSLFLRDANIMDKREEEVKDVKFDRKNLLTKAFSSQTLFIMMESGETWLNSRVALSLAHNYKLINKKTKEVTNLYDALTVKYVNNNDHSAGGTLYIPDIYVKEDGTKFEDKDWFAYINRTHAINQRLQGIYNKQDRSQAELYAAGRLVLQFRKWMKIAYNRRFNAKKYNYLLGSEEEGYYRTVYSLIINIYKDLKEVGFKMAFSSNLSNLSRMEKANLKRALIEIGSFILAFILKSLLGSGDDDDDDPLKDEPYYKRLLTYQVFRLYNELGAFVPFPTIIQEGTKILNSPAAGVNVFGNICDFITALGNPGNWWNQEEITSGDFVGHSKVYRAFMRLLPGYKTMIRNIHPERGIAYFNNASNY